MRDLGLDAYVVGGVVRDELLGRDAKDADFLVPNVDIDGLRTALAPHGRAEDLVVAGRVVGLRFHPRDARIRRLVPVGIEVAPPRRERSTGPGRHDFEIVVDPEASVEDDLGRRDFTVNAIARRLGDGTIVDPFDGRGDLERRVLRAVSAHSMAEDPLRLVRGLRFVSQLGLEPDEETFEQMQAEAELVRLVSGERIGGGLAADAMGELSKLLLGPEPRRALRLARETGILGALLPELHERDRNELTFAVVQAAAELDAPLRLRLAALLGAIGPDSAAGVLRRLRYPNEVRDRVVQIVRHHAFDFGAGDPLSARLLLAQHGEPLVRDLLDLRRADVIGAAAPAEELVRLDAFQEVVEHERRAPHRLRDLAIGGDDLLALGIPHGPAIGRALDQLLEAVVREPALNVRDELLRRAEELR